MEQMLIDCIEDPDPDVARYAVSKHGHRTYPVAYIDQLAANEYVLRTLDAAERKPPKPPRPPKPRPETIGRLKEPARSPLVPW
jgi:hypothetical protein